MIRRQFSSVSASESGDYFQVLFEEDGDNPEADYFLLQRQFEDPAAAAFYIESNDAEFCGHVRVEGATLSRRWLRLEIPSTKWKSIKIEFTADQVVYSQLARILNTMLEDRLRHVHLDA